MLNIVKLKPVRLPANFPFHKAIRKVLGDFYKLDLVFATPALMKTLNKRYRKKNKGTNVLSFGLSKEEGQIFMDPVFIRKEAADYNRSFGLHLWRLFLHGLLHLKGYDHELNLKEGLKMARAEARLVKFFGI